LVQGHKQQKELPKPMNIRGEYADYKHQKEKHARCKPKSSIHSHNRTSLIRIFKYNYMLIDESASFLASGMIEDKERMPEDSASGQTLIA
jgi:hypothetical protein